MKKRCGIRAWAAKLKNQRVHLKRNEFIEKMKLEPDGQELLDLMESGEWRICERMGLCEAYYEGSDAYIDVPGWNNLVAHLRIVNSV